MDWYSEDGNPNVIADPLNRPLQISTVREYEQRLFKSGLAADCAGAQFADSASHGARYVGTGGARAPLITLSFMQILSPFRKLL